MTPYHWIYLKSEYQTELHWVQQADADKTNFRCPVCRKHLEISEGFWTKIQVLSSIWIRTHSCGAQLKIKMAQIHA